MPDIHFALHLAAGTTEEGTYCRARYGELVAVIKKDGLGKISADAEGGIAVVRGCERRVTKRRKVMRRTINLSN